MVVVQMVLVYDLRRVQGSPPPDCTVWWRAPLYVVTVPMGKATLGNPPPGLHAVTVEKTRVVAVGE
jgi:hypothetical protein